MSNTAGPTPVSVKIGVLFFVALLSFGLYLRTNGHPSVLEWTLFYVLIATFTGTLFWIVYPDPESAYSNKTLGISLGGAAAIGASFMALTHFFVGGIIAREDPYLLVPLQAEYQDRELKVTGVMSPGLRIEVLEDRWFLATFDGNTHEGTFVTRLLSSEGDSVLDYTFKVQRQAAPQERIIQIQPSEDPHRSR